MHEGFRLTLLLLAGSVLFFQTDVSTAVLQTINQECLADIGDTVILNCSLSSTSSVTWAKRFNQTIVVGSKLIIDDQRFLVLSTPNYSQLKISNVSKEDAGLYECRQQPSRRAAEVVKQLIQLEVRFSPVILHVEPDEVVTIEGENIQLFCNATGHPLPNVTWRRINRSMPPLDDIVFTGRRLNISNVKKADGGIYSCEAENGFGQRARTDVVVRVEFIPEVTAPDPEVLQAINYTAKLLCSIKAFPSPEIIWLKDEEEITANDTHYVITIISSADETLITETHLQFTVVRIDYGNYSCRASNRHGESSAVLSLLESRFPVLPLTKEESNTDGEEKQHVPSHFNMTGFILGMMPPLWISFYIILHLGFRSRYAEERPEEEGGDGLDEVLYEQGLHFTTKF
ncbi:hypothetical protein CHUAL_001681 [Chamberlinius hualienensis]